MYGEGNDPLIAADGQGIWYQDYGRELDSPTHVYHGYVSSAVLLYDAEYIIVRDLEITNCAEHIIGEKYSQGDKMERTGVAVVAKDKGMRRGITLKNLKIHDVNICTQKLSRYEAYAIAKTRACDKPGNKPEPSINSQKR